MARLSHLSAAISPLGQSKCDLRVLEVHQKLFGSTHSLQGESASTAIHLRRDRRASLYGRHAVVALQGPGQPKLPIHSAMAFPISSGESSWT
jgi:hypothetical protein